MLVTCGAVLQLNLMHSLSFMGTAGPHAPGCCVICKGARRSIATLAAKDGIWLHSCSSQGCYRSSQVELLYFITRTNRQYQLGRGGCTTRFR